MKELRELRMFVVVNENEEYKIIEEKEGKEKELAMMVVKENNKGYVELSINSVIGLNDPGTMKVRGKLHDEDIIILIYCGATYNFLSEKIVEKLQIPTKETTHYVVILGSGTAIQRKGVYEGGVDVVLGMQWLHSLGIIVVDWKNLMLTFIAEGKQVSIKGDPSLTKARISLKSMIKTWGEQDEDYLVECRVMEVTNDKKKQKTKKSSSARML
ncbi:ty3-gypsy retrotransposon protein [Cucumis melo var. makuwa]|uniref:Ty3-gypsy retrotransposon protein n=1 Tax=Cucumis melo var. makuwa TaxID=1194695 RepID=A0A5A7TJI6_CUCMM|nr:ty3-gypsy retrotransposon protein [Cucumis melo var. makuwa]TYK05401.1 ty3-gypsy retrotransposon protein [Cucumis melo var. makuwa]